jgi:hypothetical protein
MDELLAEISKWEEIDDLRTFLSSRSDQTELRNQLLQLLRTVVEYDDAAAWSKAVRICESLAITGWGDWERVDACTHFDGDSWDTWFINHQGEYRFRRGHWTKRKAGWCLFNPTYHVSPHVPEIPAKSWEEYAGIEFPCVDLPKLPSQRNPQKQMPIVMGLICGDGPVSERVWDLKRELTKLLIQTMRPEIYGDAINRFFLTLYCAADNRAGRATHDGLKIGSYRAKQKAFYCELHLDSKFGPLSSGDQKKVFISAIQESIKALETKFVKLKLEYDFAAFRSDIVSAFELWE